MAEPVKPSTLGDAEAAPLAAMAARIRALEERIASLEERHQPAETRPRASRRRRELEAPVHEHGFDLETAVGLTWLNRAGAVLLIIGLGLATFWANDRGYLTPLIRELLGGSLAIALFSIGACATASTEPGRRAFGSGVTLVGAFGLYLVPISASRVDALLSLPAAGAIMIAVTVSLAVLSLLLDRFLLALIGLAGGLVLPLALRAGEPHHALLFTYLSLLCSGFVGLQLRKRWPWLDLIACFGLSAYYLSWLAEPGPVSAPAALVGLGLWAAHLACARVRSQSFGAWRDDDGFHVALLCAAGLGGYGALFTDGDRAGLCVALGLGLLGYHVFAWRQPSRPRFAFALLALLLLATTTLLVGAEGPPGAWRAPVVASLGCMMFVAAYLARAETGTRLLDEDHALAAAGSAAFLCFWLIAGAHWGRVAVAALPIGLLGLAWLAAATWLRRAERAANAAEWATIFATLLCTAATVLGFEAFAADRYAMSLASTIAIVLCGLALVRIGVRASLAASRIAGLAVLSLAVVKLLTLDVWMLSPGHRIAALVALGAGLLGASFLYGHYADATHSPEDAPLLTREELERRRERLLDAVGQVPNDPGLLARLDDHRSP